MANFKPLVLVELDVNISAHWSVMRALVRGFDIKFRQFVENDMNNVVENDMNNFVENDTNNLAYFVAFQPKEMVF